MQPKMEILPIEYTVYVDGPTIEINLKCTMKTKYRKEKEGVFIYTTSITGQALARKEQI